MYDTPIHAGVALKLSMFWMRRLFAEGKPCKNVPDNNSDMESLSKEKPRDRPISEADPYRDALSAAYALAYESVISHATISLLNADHAPNATMPRPPPDASRCSEACVTVDEEVYADVLAHTSISVLRLTGRTCALRAAHGYGDGETDKAPGKPPRRPHLNYLR